MLNDKYAVESSKLSDMESILNSIGFLSEEKEEDKSGEKEEHKYKKSGKKSKDYDGDGEVEDESHEYAGVKDRAIKKAMKKEDVNFSSVLDELTDENLLFLTDELIEEVVEEFFYETLEEGFEVEEIETLLIESIDAELSVLSEAKVTVGHDTEDTTPKEDKLSKVKSAIKKVASGAKKVAKKVAGAAGEVAGAAKAGYKKASDSGESDSSSSSSGSTIPRGTSQKPGFLARAGAALKSGLKKVVGKTARVASKVGDKVATRLGEETLDEKAPPGKKYERMVKHIKAGYKEGGVTDTEKRKSYGAAWKAYNKEEVEYVEEGKNKEGKEQGSDGKACWKGYKYAGTDKNGKDKCVPMEEYQELYLDMIEEGYDLDQVREVLAAYEDGFEVIFEEDGYMINDELEILDEEFLSDVEILADWLHMEGVIENEDQFFELMEDLTEDEIQELYDVVFEATAMAKRGHDEAEIRNKIAANTKGGKSADRATALADKQTFKGDGSARDKYARAQRGDHRKTTSSNPGLHGYAHKSDDPKVKAKQAARGAQRGSATLTPNERKKLNMGYEVIGDSLENGGLEVQTIQEISADLALRASREADKKRGKLAQSGDSKGAVKKMAQASRLYKKQTAKRLGRNENVEMIGDSLEEGGLEVRNYSWREVLEAQEARNNPEKYEAGQKKKYAPVRGEKTPMPPRGDKRREDFEKWYAKNVR